MSLQQRLVAAGIPATAAAAIQGTVQSGLTAAGTTQATAAIIPADVNMFGTVASGAGAILPAMNPGDDITVFNGGANALKLYPPVGAVINALSTNGAYSIATTTPLCFVQCVGPLQYLANQAA